MSEVIEAPTTIWTDRFIKRELIPAGELARRFNILNPRAHPEAQREATESSLDTVGWIDEISLSTNGDGPASLADNPAAVMFDGHERVELVLVRGGENALVPVKWYQLSAEETDFALLVKDQTTGMAETKPKELAALLERTKTVTVDPRLGALLAALKAKAGINGNGQGDNGNEPAMPTETEAERLAQQYETAPGQVWALGRHIIACLDSTDEAAVRELIGGKPVGMVWADPPYGMELDTDYTAMNGSANNVEFKQRKKVVGGKKYPSVIGDSTDFDPAPLIKILSDTAEQFWWGADYYAERIPDKNNGSWLVWDKRDDNEQFDKMFGSAFELCWSRIPHKRELLRVRWCGVFGTEQEPDKKRFHPTQKPVNLALGVFAKYGKPETIIFDPFLGSGTSILAAEKINDGRRVIGCELAHEYIAVVLFRWQRMTGQTPRRVSG